MTSTYQINIRNGQAQTVDFVIFLEQPQFNDGGSGLAISTNSLGTSAVASYPDYHTEAQFSFETQIYAGARTNQLNPANKARNAQQPVQISSQPIALAETNDQKPNHTTLSIAPFGLTPAVYDSSVPTGNFEIAVPSYTPTQALSLVCGISVVQLPSRSILASYVSPLPASTLYCEPLPKFYVSVGSSAVGTLVHYDTTNAACCDFSLGYSQFLVTYETDGHFTVAGSL